MKTHGLRRARHDAGPNMTPLVDVVMVILTFLMLTGSFGAAAHFLPAHLPVNDDRRGPGIPKPPVTYVEVYLSPPSGGAFRATLGGGESFGDGALRSGRRWRPGAWPTRPRGVCWITLR